jgi:tripartite-type tricarboxylate transporter receptor subunit TctC
MFFRKILLWVLVIGMFLNFFLIGALAVYPDKDITLFVHVSPGGTTDMMARTVAKHMEKKLGVSIILKYLPGAGKGYGLEKEECDHSEEDTHLH